MVNTASRMGRDYAVNSFLLGYDLNSVQTLPLIPEYNQTKVNIKVLYSL